MRRQPQAILTFLAVATAIAVFFPGAALDAAGSEAAAGSKVIPIEDFERLRLETNSVVLDVRTPGEFKAGHVPGAVNLDWNGDDFEAAAGRLDKQKTYLVHCASGNRSARAVAKMGRMGFSRLYDFSGGWRAWQKAGKPVER